MLKPTSFLKPLLTNYLDNRQKPESNPFFYFFLAKKHLVYVNCQSVLTARFILVSGFMNSIADN